MIRVWDRESVSDQSMTVAVVRLITIDGGFLPGSPRAQHVDTHPLRVQLGFEVPVCLLNPFVASTRESDIGERVATTFRLGAQEDSTSV